MNIVCIGGGTGLFTLLSGLKALPDVELSAIVTMMDDGGSTGRLRTEFGHLPTGDVRRCLIALADAPKEMLALMGYRYDTGAGLQGHSLGNLILTASKEIAGGEYEGITYLERILQVRGKVYPVTLDDVHLVARLEDGREIRGETRIDIPTVARAPIRSVQLSSSARLFPKAREAIQRADCIIIGPGDLYTSIMPNLLVHGIVDAMATACAYGARVMYVVNTMTKHGETDGYKASDFVQRVQQAIGSVALDAVIVNTGRIHARQERAYALERAEPVENDLVGPGVHAADVVADGTFARHDPAKLAAVLHTIITQGNA